MSIWAKIAKYGGSALKGAGSVAKQGLKSASNTAVHPTQAKRRRKCDENSRRGQRSRICGMAEPCQRQEHGGDSQ